MQLARKTEPVSATAPLALVSWYSAGGVEPPAVIASLSPAILRGPDELQAAAVCFLDAAGQGAIGLLHRLRMRFADGPYLVAVTGPADAELHAELFEAGADDLLFEDAPLSLLRCLLRAKRHLELIHARERALMALQDRLNAWQDGLDHLPTPIYLKDVDGRYLGCNRAFSQFVGAERDAVIGQTLGHFLPADVAQAHRETDCEVLQKGGVLRVETDVCVPETGVRHIMLHKARVASPEGDLRGIAGVLIDITERKELEARLIAAAERDPLTNAYNRRKFFEVANSAVEQVTNGNLAFAVAVIDIDHFKSINDELGHGEGDLTLCSIVDTLRAHESEGVLIARAGGEEFFVFFSGETAERAADILERMRADIARYCQVSTGAGPAGTISIGLALFNPAHETVDHALRRADLALYRAKRDGRNRLCKAD